MFTWSDSILSFDSADPYAGKCEQNVNRKKKIVVTKVNFKYMRSQSANPLAHGKSAIWGVAHPLRPISYYTYVKFSMKNHSSWETGG